MIIDVLIIRADGTQILEQREVPDNYFTPEELEIPPEEQ